MIRMIAQGFVAPPSGLALTLIAEAHGSGGASLSAGVAGDLVIGLVLQGGGNVSGGSALATLCPGYSSGASYVISGGAVSISGPSDCFLFRYRPSKAITSVTANGTLTQINTSSGSIPAFGTTGVNLVMGIGQELSSPAFLQFTSLSNAYASHVMPTYASAQVAINPTPTNAAPFTVTGGSFYGSTYANAVQVNIQ